MNEVQMLKDIIEHDNKQINELQDVIISLNKEIIELKGGITTNEMD